MAKTTAKKTAKKAAKKSAKKTSSRTGSSRQPAQKTQEEVQSALLELFVEEVKDIYWAEKHLAKALPKMQKAAYSPELQEAFATHLEQTQVHAQRLEEVFELLEEPARAKKCDAMEGLVEEAKSIIEDTEEGTATRDVGLILAAQKVEHYEIATYGGLTQLAKTMGRDDVAEILGQTLVEEKETDELLTEIAENKINYEATSDEG